MGLLHRKLQSLCTFRAAAATSPSEHLARNHIETSLVQIRTRRRCGGDRRALLRATNTSIRSDSPAGCSRAMPSPRLESAPWVKPSIGPVSCRDRYLIKAACRLSGKARFLRVRLRLHDCLARRPCPRSLQGIATRPGRRLVVVGQRNSKAGASVVQIITWRRRLWLWPALAVTVDIELTTDALARARRRTSTFATGGREQGIAH